MFCPRCGLRQPTEHRFCVACGVTLPRHLVPKRGHKVSRWFWGIPVSSEDPPSAALRVTRYLEEFEITTAEGSVRVPDHHVRFSVWEDARATCAISIPDDEAERLAGFLLAHVADGDGEREPLLS